MLQTVAVLLPDFRGEDRYAQSRQAEPTAVRCSVSMSKALLATQRRAASSCSPNAPREGGGECSQGSPRRIWGTSEWAFFGSGVGLPRETEHEEHLTKKHLKIVPILMTRTVKEGPCLKAGE